ncbi:DUF7935 family protein [Sinomicrobium soli]|uniref:DUF7935 family protein n=1 Tax=Sinomicrobium sp. N-1-3-6 TaxID=2219864 RepID=UPI000DCD4EE1|nr:hypothetical protein [Sinomicrobium sp. N-1-3-6]RAV30140.1 hypothetical protein DN748_04915 [Sinomicrobium sp. N-1-3-6]
MIQLTDILLYILPAAITGLVAYYFFAQFVKNEQLKRRFLLQREAQKHTFPIRLQAYERMALFLERTDPVKLLLRVVPSRSMNTAEYEALLIRSIEEEYDHNLSQQIYMSDQCWSIIKTAKNSTIQLIRKASMTAQPDSPEKLREVILSEMMDKTSPSATALQFIRKEVRDFMN